MSFQTVYVYDADGTFLGLSIYKPGAQKLHTANLWQNTPEDTADLARQLERLNDDVDVRAFWPDCAPRGFTAGNLGSSSTKKKFKEALIQN
jgi:hypothetical protein